MSKPRIFLRSSTQQTKLLQSLMHGLEDVAQVEAWTASFNPGAATLERLLDLVHEVDFAAFAFVRDDGTTRSSAASDPCEAGQASPRHNVIFEAGLFGGVQGIRRTFILHPSDPKLPSSLLGLTCIPYGEELAAAERRAINQKLHRPSNAKAIASSASRMPDDGFSGQCDEPIERVTDWFEEVDKLSPETLTRLMELGEKVQKLLEFKDRVKLLPTKKAKG